MRMVRLSCALIATILVCLYAAQAQSQEGKETQKSQDEVLTLKAHLVNIDVMVKDKKGKYVTDLKAEDFTILENGVRQKVEFLDPPLARDYKTGQPGADAQAATTTQAASPTPGGRAMNIISLVLDGQTTELSNLKQVREGTIKYIRERIADTDTVALFAVTGGLQLLQPFTQDKAKLIAAVEKAYSISTSSKNFEQRDISEEIANRRDELKRLEGAPPGSVQAQAAVASRALQQFLKLRSQLSLQQSRPVLAALAAICEAQHGIPGKKTLVLFSQGFVTSAPQDWQVQGTVDLANRANVAIYIIDSAGLTASAPRSGAPVPSTPLEGVSALSKNEDRIQAVGGENVFDHVRHEGSNREQDILYRISGDTGGKFIKGSNDIAKGLDQIDQETRARYTLAYYTTDVNFDGGFRKLKVEVNRPEAHVISRSGYYAIASGDIVPLSPEDKKLLANFGAAEANPALPLFVELSPFRSQEGQYIVPLSMEVPPAAMKFDQKGDKQRMQFDVLVVVRESQDKILSRLGGNFDVEMAAEQYQAILNNNIFYRQDMELAPGSYSIELIVRDRLSGKMAARKEKLVLPVAGLDFSTSGVVLSRLALPSKNLRGSGDVLSQGGVQIRPSAGREFRPADNLIIFFELYNAAASAETGKPLVRVTVTLMKDGKAAMKPIDYMLTERLIDPVPHLTFAKYISLAKLPAGKYVAMIEAVDVVTHKLVTQQASFVVRQ
jgi:VWFA-related protein